MNSGDLGRLDEDGYLWLTGRAKDVIIRGGHNIDPQAIEEVFFQHPAVALAAVVAQPDAYAGELPVAFVQLNPNMPIDEADLIAFVRERTPERAAVPVHVYFVDAMPLTGVGKVFKPILRADAARVAVGRILAGLQTDSCTLNVTVRADQQQGSVITVAVGGVPDAQRDRLESELHGRLNPLVMPHEIVWQP